MEAARGEVKECQMTTSKWKAKEEGSREERERETEREGRQAKAFPGQSLF